MIVTSYIHSIEDKNQLNAINSCLKSINDDIENSKPAESKQSFSEIVYNGKSVTEAKVTNPRKLSANIPVIGTINGIQRVVGYTDGESITTVEIPKSITRSTAEYVDSWEPGTSESYKDDSVTTIVVTTEAGQFIKYTTVVKSLENGIIRIAMRF